MIAVRTIVPCILLIIVSSTLGQQTAADICGQFKTCVECIRGDVSCSWCGDDGSTETADNNSTTITVSNKQRCKVAEQQDCAVPLQNPKSKTLTVEDNAFTDSETDTIQLKPQHVTVSLRKGSTQIVNITYRKTIEYPLDLYYLMDLSNSMKDDLDSLQGLGNGLLREINETVTQNARMGFGTFVDKVLMPYTSTVPEQMENPCMKNENGETCSPSFGFRHQLSLTNDQTAVQDVVSNTKVSGNIDSPEGGFDALMQVAVCQERIGWKKEALRVILFTTDASPHIAWDGKLAAILEANDMKCHLDMGPHVHQYIPDEYIYAKSKYLDYPSIGQLREVFKEKNIQTIFAVTNETYDIYKEINGLIPNSYVQELAADSSNVIPIINASYNALKDKISINPPDNIPNNIELKYRTLCPGSDTFTENELACEKVEKNKEAVFQFELTATSCPKNPTQSDVIKIATDSLLNEITITVDYLCECQCAENQVTASAICTGNGNYSCGVCECDAGWLGRKCHCEDKNTGVSLEEQCINSGLEEGMGDVCSGNGECECGSCECKENYFDTYCQCSTIGCQRGTNDEVCGGLERGTCRNCNLNKECVCKNGWSQKDPSKKNGACECNADVKCKQSPEDEKICNGHGYCDCDSCVCATQYAGPYCELCRDPICSVLTGEDGEDLCRNPWLEGCALCHYNMLMTGGSGDSECDHVCRNITEIDVDYFQTLPDCRPGSADMQECELNDQSRTCIHCNEASDLIPPEKLPQLGEECTVVADKSCVAQYRIYWKKKGDEYSLLVKEFDPENDCPKPLPSHIIIASVVGAIVLVGVILLILWKIFQIASDKREYKKFLEEERSRNWTQGENPLFSKASSRIENPAFVGGK